MFGQIAYEAYRNHTGGKSLVSGQPIPEWGELRPEIQAAWEAAAEAVRAHIADQVLSKMREAVDAWGKPVPQRATPDGWKNTAQLS